MHNKLLKSSIFLFSLLFLGFFYYIQSSIAAEPRLLAQGSTNRSCGQRCGRSSHGGNTFRCATGLVCVSNPGGGLGMCVPPGCTWANRLTCCSVLTTTPPASNLTPTGGVGGPVPTVLTSSSPTRPPSDALSGAPAASPTGIPTSGAPTSSTPPKSDCASAVGPGILDGKVDLIDIDQLRKELSKQETTLHCDFDKNSSVDIIDFTDYMRKDFITVQPFR